MSDPRGVVPEAVAENTSEPGTKRQFQRQAAMSSKVLEASGDYDEMAGGERDDGAIDSETKAPNENRHGKHVGHSLE